MPEYLPKKKGESQRFPLDNPHFYVKTIKMITKKGIN